MKSLIIFSLLLLIFTAGCNIDDSFRANRYLRNCVETASDNYHKNLCYLNAVKINPDLNICDKIKVIGEKYSCSEVVYGEVCISDASIKGGCYENVALKKKNIEICGKIEDPFSKDFCYSEFARQRQDLNICDKIATRYLKGICYSDFAVNKRDISICNKIQDINAKGSCYSSIASITNNLEICNQIENQNSKDECYNNMVSKDYNPLKDINVCHKIQNQTISGYCYTKIASYEKDSKYCDLISESVIEIKDECYYSDIIYRETSSACDNIKDLWLRDTCYRDFVTYHATNLESINTCRKMGRSIYSVDDCLGIIAAAKKDPSICDNGIEKDYCLSSAADISQDTMFCNNIYSPDIRYLCIANSKV